jgi:hypothetical protein
MADLIYDDTGPSTTAAAFVNSSNEPISVTIVVHGHDGAEIGSTQLVLAARSKQAAMLRSLPGLAAMAGNRGWAAFSVPNGVLAVVGLRFGEGAYTTVPVNHRSSPVAAPLTSALPQLVSGGGWSSSVYFSNTTGRAVSFQLNFIENKGTPLNLPSFGTSQTISLNPGATAILEAPNLSVQVTGWAEAALPPGVIGHAVFRQMVAGRATQEAVVPLIPESNATARMIYDDTGVFTTAAAFLNPGSQPVLVNIAVYSVDGAEIALLQLPLQPRAKRAEILRNLPGLEGIAGKRGRIIFSVPNGAVSVLGIRFAQAAFTSIPVSQE